ncbi:MAG TPA: hypothetical protein VL404_08240 [Candidatus Eisenbacteria bacterium]|jgi:chromosome segregation ATPase|nr:hypothetical protein [Candidatus Eisenbacteria bacterium]
MKRGLPLAAGVVFFSLLFLLVKENEGRTAAETKLKDLQYRLDTANDEKSDVANDLEAKIAALEGRLQETTERYEALLAEKGKAIEALDAGAREAEARHAEELKARDGELADRDARSKKDVEKFTGLLGEKSAEITDLGARLEEASKRIAALLKKKESLEAKMLAADGRIEELERAVKELEKKNAQLSADLAKTRQETAVSD